LCSYSGCFTYFLIITHVVIFLIVQFLTHSDYFACDLMSSCPLASCLFIDFTVNRVTQNGLYLRGCR